MYFGYNVETNRGWIPPFTEESNVPSDFPADNLLCIHTPHPDTVRTHRALLVYPVTGSPFLKGTDVPEELIKPWQGMTIGKTTTGVPVIMGQIIEEKDIPKGATVTRMGMDIPGHSPIGVGVIIAVIVVVAISLTLTTMFITDYFKVQEVEKTRRHENDLAMHWQAVVDRREQDLNNDGIDDIEYITFGNGEIVRTPISDYGIEVYGANPEITHEGTDLDALLALFEEREKERLAKEWIGDVAKGALIIGGVAVGGYGFFKWVLPEVREWRKKPTPRTV